MLLCELHDPAADPIDQAAAFTCPLVDVIAVKDSPAMRQRMARRAELGEAADYKLYCGKTSIFWFMNRDILEGRKREREFNGRHTL